MAGPEVILSALAAGSSAEVSGSTTEVIKDTKEALKLLIRRRLVGRDAARAALMAEHVEPAAWEASIGRDLRASGAADDQQIVRLAEELLALTGAGNITARPGGVAAGTITGNVTINGPAGSFNVFLGNVIGGER